MESGTIAHQLTMSDILVAGFVVFYVLIIYITTKHRHVVFSDAKYRATWEYVISGFEGKNP
jgi:hypothetical protein